MPEAYIMSYIVCSVIWLISFYETQTYDYAYYNMIVNKTSVWISQRNILLSEKDSQSFQQRKTSPHSNSQSVKPASKKTSGVTSRNKTSVLILKYRNLLNCRAITIQSNNEKQVINKHSECTLLLWTRSKMAEVTWTLVLSKSSKIK